MFVFVSLFLSPCGCFSSTVIVIVVVVVGEASADSLRIRTPESLFFLESLDFQNLEVWNSGVWKFGIYRGSANVKSKLPNFQRSKQQSWDVQTSKVWSPNFPTSGTQKTAPIFKIQEFQTLKVCRPKVWILEFGPEHKIGSLAQYCNKENAHLAANDCKRKTSGSYEVARPLALGCFPFK